MISELFDFILNNYNNGYKNAERTDPNYDVLVHQIPIALNTAFPFRQDLLVVGSCGIGQKTDYPWIAIFNKNITTSAKRGIYVVYLFKKDMSGFYLTLNQGITYFADTYRRRKYEYARKVADYFRNEIGDSYFSKEDIDLNASSSTLGYGYQETNIISKYYSKNSLSDLSLTEDLKKMLNIYDELVGVLGENNYDYNDAINKIVFDYNEPFEDAVDSIDNIKKAISSATDLNIVRSLRYVEPKERSTKKYSAIRKTTAIKKTDWLKKAKTDAEIGLLGEMLALSYERERLIKEGYSDLADKIQHVSMKMDSYGYDIVSYQRFGLKYEKVYLEVKTTTNKLDVDFQVSINEVSKSNEKKDHYCVFRIYDVKSAKPSFYKVFGKIEDHFELNPITFMATYVGNKKKK